MMVVDLQHFCCKLWITKLDQLEFLLSKVRQFAIVFSLVLDPLVKPETFSSPFDYLVHISNRIIERKQDEINIYSIRFRFLHFNLFKTKVIRREKTFIWISTRPQTSKIHSFVTSNKMAAGTHMAATQQAADDQASSLYFSGICQTISVKCQHRNENGLLTCSRNLYVSCKISFSRFRFFYLIFSS